MRLVHNDHGLPVLHGTHDLDLFMQCVSCGVTQKLRFTAELHQQIIVKAAWSQLRIRDVQHHVFRFRQLVFQTAERTCLTRSGFTDQNSKELVFGGVFRSAERFIQWVWY